MEASRVCLTVTKGGDDKQGYKKKSAFLYMGVIMKVNSGKNSKKRKNDKK